VSPTKCRLRHLRPCEGRGEFHHVVPKARIKARLPIELLPAAINDRRNLVPLCRRHHHRITHGFDRDAMAEVLAERLDDLRAFASAYGVEAGLERELRNYRIEPSGEAEPA
jgi:hypothetical protein